MDGILVLIGLVVLAIPVAVIALIVGQVRLRDRVSRLEAQLASHRIGAPAEMMPSAASAPVAPPTAPEPVPEPIAPGPVSASPTPASPTPGRWAAAATAAASTVSEAAAPQAQRPEEPAPPAPPSGPIVLRADRFAAFAAWMQRNWIYVVSAASLALAGVFLVQYSVQNGLLPPEARVIAAYLFGAALIAAAEWLRRRGGDGEKAGAAYVPSTFAGAGVVTLFAATVAAQQLYAMIGAELAFGLHVITAALAVVLGWYYGPLLVAFGLIGASAAPFLVSTGAGPTAGLYAYYALIAATGLAVDAIRRWAWLSVLALVLAYGGGAAMMTGGAGQGAWLAFLLALPALSLALPRLRLFPDHPAPSLFVTLWTRGAEGWPEFPVRLALGSTVVTCLALLFFDAQSPLEGLLALAALSLLALALLLWAERAEGLADLALLPAATMILRLWSEALGYGPLAAEFWANIIEYRPPETAPPLTATLLAGMAALVSLGFAYRALRGGGLSLVHGLGAVLTAPVAVAVLELAWDPARVVGPMTWALHPLAQAALMVGLAERFARADGADHRRMAHATLSALSLIALALFVLTSATALTLALAVLVLAAAWLDRRYDLREMGVFIQAAVAVLSWRLLIDPGVDWAMDGPVLQVILAFVGPIAAYVGGLWLLRERGRVMTSGVLESAALSLAAILANVLLTRALVPQDLRDNTFDLAHVMSLNAMPWLVLALTQTYRAGLGPVLRRTRLALGVVAGVLAGGGLVIAAIPLNPLFFLYPGEMGALVKGPWLLDTLALAYALPALVLLAAAWRLHFPRLLRLGLICFGAALATLYVGLEIRRFWQGDWLAIPGVTEPELYSYTIAMMLAGAGLLLQAIRQRSHTLRRVAMAVIALVIAKVFLIDASGLTGLTRVFSFLGLGLSLAGLAWVNRWADRQLSKDMPSQQG